MRSRYEAVLNGQALSSISASILILDIQYAAPSIKNETYSVAKRQGARLHRRYYDKASVTINFEIHEYGTANRMKVCNAIQRWAKNGGVLQTNDREGQRLRCICDAFPVIKSALKWTDVLSVTFSAYSLPFWEEVTPASVTLSGNSTIGRLFVPGCVDGAFGEVDIVTGGTLTSIDLIVNSKTMTLSGISVTSGKTIKISYDDDMIQSIKVDNTSLLNKRTGIDDLCFLCGDYNSVGVSANVSCDVTFKVRGLWL